MATTDVFILNVGAGSCAVISHPNGRTSMIDINNGRELRRYERLALSEARAAQLTSRLVNPVGWYRRVFDGRELWRFILSHPDSDHMAGVRCILNGEIDTANFWDLPHTRQAPDQYQTDHAREDWLIYETFRASDPSGTGPWPKRIGPLRFDTGDYWTEDGIEILSPSRALVNACNEGENWNDISYVLRVSDRGRSVLLPGDVEQPAWNDLAIAAAGQGISLRSDVLVASHHGRKSGYPGEGVLEEINPAAVIVSTAALEPKDDALPDYQWVVGNVFSTRAHGSLLVRIWDDGRLTIASGVDTFERIEELFWLPAIRRAAA
jgi:beta-lactamase superfamily II metal-dependent hydrolase